MLDPEMTPVVHEASLLTTMAIMKVNYDVSRDYLANFEPFALDCVKHWPRGDSVKPEQLREELRRRFALPSVPINAAQELRDRLCRDGYLARRTTGRRSEFLPIPSRLHVVPDLDEAQSVALAQMVALRDALMLFASKDEDAWPPERAEHALESFVGEFSAELALFQRRLFPLRHQALRTSDVVVVHAFVRSLMSRDPDRLRFLEDMVKGSMLVNVLYFQGLGDWKTRLPALEVYLDTQIVLRALDLAPHEQVAAALELVNLARSFEISLRVFRHTVDEIEGVLDGAAEALRQAHEAHVRPMELINVNSEVVDRLGGDRWSAMDVHQFAAALPGKLRALGIQVVEPPVPPVRPDYDETALESTLEAILTKQAPYTRAKDVQSLVGVHNLRRKHDCRTLERTPAVFVTANTALVKASAAYFGRSKAEGRVRHCLSDVSLTTQLWVRKPERSPQIARKLLIAESSAALSPDSELWERYLTEIEKQQAAGVLSDEQVKLLVYRMETREPLLDLTHGQAEAVTDETPAEVLERYDEQLLDPPHRRLDAALDALRSAEDTNKHLMAHLEVVKRESEAHRTTAEKHERALEVLVAQTLDHERAIGEGARRLRWLVPGFLLGIAAAAMLAALIVLAVVGGLHRVVPWGTLGIGDVMVGYCACLLCAGHVPQPHSRRWHLAAYVLLVPVGSGIVAWAAQQTGGWWVTAMAFATGLFGTVYAIYAFARPGGDAGGGA